MKPIRLLKIEGITVILFCIAVLTGCIATFDEVQGYESKQKTIRIEAKKVVLAIFRSNFSSNRAIQLERDCLKRTLKENGLVLVDIEIDPEADSRNVQIPDTPKILVDFFKEESTGLQATQESGSMLLFGATLFVFPGYAHRDIRAKFTIIESNRSKEFVYSSGTNLYFSILALFCPEFYIQAAFTPEAYQKPFFEKTIGHITEAFVHDAISNGFLKE